jgi:hypothetical protein
MKKLIGPVGAGEDEAVDEDDGEVVQATMNNRVATAAATAVNFFMAGSFLEVAMIELSRIPRPFALRLRVLPTHLSSQAAGS